MNADEERNCQLARTMFSTLSSGDLEALRALIHPEGSWEVMRAEPRSRFASGRDAIIDDFLAPVRGRFVPGDPKITVHTMFGSGSLVAAETRADGTLANGNEYRNRYAWIIEIVDGMVCHVREYMDTQYVRTVT